MAQFGEISNSVGLITAGNCTFNGVSIPRALHSDRNNSTILGETLLRCRPYWIFFASSTL